ncbi:pyrimidine-specific ribonucleoside hydrolase RihB, partial [Striga asiatica]
MLNEPLQLPTTLAAAFWMATPISAARLLISSPSSPAAINLPTASLTTRALTNSSRFSQSLATSPVFRTLVMKIALIDWSVCMGHANTGTPVIRLSKHEFHPQCVRNPPVASWANISTCGAQSLTTSLIPAPFTLSSNPSGNSIIFLLSPEKMSALSASLNAYTNLNPYDSSPRAISRASSPDREIVVPNETYKTDPRACPSSQSRHHRAYGPLLTFPADYFLPSEEVDVFAPDEPGRVVYVPGSVFEMLGPRHDVVYELERREGFGGQGVLPKDVKEVKRQKTIESIRLDVGNRDRVLDGLCNEAVVNKDFFFGFGRHFLDKGGDRVAEGRVGRHGQAKVVGGFVRARVWVGCGDGGSGEVVEMDMVRIRVRVVSEFDLAVVGGGAEEVDGEGGGGEDEDGQVEELVE